MTIKQSQWTERYIEALNANVSDLHEKKQIANNAYIPDQYSSQIASEFFEKGSSPEEAARYTAMSLVRMPLIDEIQKLTIEKRSLSDKSKIAEIDARLNEDKRKYNSIMGMNCFETTDIAKKPIMEGSDAIPTMICWGRGYGENTNAMDTSVINRFNNLVARNDPYTGMANPVLSRIQQFNDNNASKYSVDPDPELDKYVDTVFVDDMGPEAFTINGENPYRVLDKIRAGEDVNLNQVHGTAVIPRQQDIVKEETQEEPGYVESFDEIFSLGK